MNPHISDEELLEIAKQLGANIDWGGYDVIYRSDTYNNYGLAMSVSPAAVGGFVISREEYEERIKLLIDQHMAASCSKCEGLEHSYNLDADNECQTCQVERKELMPILYEQFGDSPTWHNTDIKESVILNCTKDTFSSKLGHIKKEDYVLGGSGFLKDYFNLVCTREQYLNYVKTLQLSTDAEKELNDKEELYCSVLEALGETIINNSPEFYNIVYCPTSKEATKKYNHCGFILVRPRHLDIMLDADPDAEVVCSTGDIQEYLNAGNGPSIGDLGLLPDATQRKHAHYFKDVSELDEADVYQVCHIFQVQDFSGCKHHSIKKLLLSGGRGVKDEYKDVSEARDTLNRWLEINKPK